MPSLQLAVWLSCYNVINKEFEWMIIHFGNNNHSAVSKLERFGYANVISFLYGCERRLLLETRTLIRVKSKGFRRFAVELKHAGILDVHICVQLNRRILVCWTYISSIWAVELMYWYIGHMYVWLN